MNTETMIDPASAVTTMPVTPVSTPKKPVPVPSGPKPFEPKPKVVFTNGNPSKKLNSRDRLRILKIFNQTRTGKRHFTVEILYDKQTDAKPRIHGPDFQAPTGISMTHHLGLVCKAEISKEGKFYITLIDSLRQNRGKVGFSSLRLEGIKSLKIITENDGPVPPKPI